MTKRKRYTEDDIQKLGGCLLCVDHKANNHKLHVFLFVKRQGMRMRAEKIYPEIISTKWSTPDLMDILNYEPYDITVI